MQIENRDIDFLSDGIKLKGTLFYPLPQNGYYGILFLHGGGRYTKSLYLDWQKFLAKQGYSSLSFFCRGVGNSNGQFEDSSLNNRLKDSEAALNFFLNSGVVNPSMTAVSGSSMGAHVAIKLAIKDKRIKALILQSAAAYPKEAEDKKLDNSFSRIIQQSHSWADLPIFNQLAEFNHPVLTVYGENDTVIPAEVKNQYRRVLKKGMYLEIKGATHKLLAPTNKVEEKARQKLFTASLSFLDVSFR